MKRGDIATYPEWLTTVEKARLLEWLEKESKLIMEGNEFATIFEGPYPIKQETKDDDELDKTLPQIKVPRTLRLQWFATELNRRENGGEAAPKVRF